ncbi:MAG: IS3 family transposase, partial [Planctomycetes bacterium]|nr:IS3 family transposase [Planctomycetota bacterium]
MEIDNCTRECVMEILEFLISGQRLSRKLGRLSRPSSATRVCDNGPECTFRALFIWAKEPAVRLNFIQPGKPTWVR